MHDEGSATLAAIIAGIVIMCSAACALAGAETVLARHRLAGVADLVALAGAQSGSEYAGAGECTRASEMAALNQARLVGCSMHDDDVVVEIDAPAPVLTTRLLRLIGAEGLRISAQARAGW